MSKHRTTNRFNLSGAVPTSVNSRKNKSKSTLLSQEQLKQIESRRKEEVIFSWRFFDRHNELFNMGDSDKDWFISLLDALRDLSRMTITEFRQQSKRRGLRVHSHDWKRASAKFNFDHEWFEQNNENCLQFSISKARGRVHGFLIDNIFYIVWLDPEHNLYPPRERNGKVKKCDFPVTEYEMLEYHHNNLKEQYDSLKKDFEACESLLDECK